MVDYDSTFVHGRDCHQANPPLDRSAFGAAFVVAHLMSGWVCQWKPSWIPVEDSFKKAFVEEWVFISDEPSVGPKTVEVPMLHNTDHSEYIRRDSQDLEAFHFSTFGDREASR